jgi:hypothetical protein
MKNRIIIAFMILMSINAFSQSSVELRPDWARSTPNPPAGANYFLSWGVGEGSNESDATNAAWADALQKSLHELRVVGITQQDIHAVAAQGIDAVTKFSQVKRRIVNATEPIVTSGQTLKIYLLVQVQRNVNGPDDFYQLNTSLYEDPDFNRQLKEYNARLTGKYPFSARVFVPGMAQLHKGSKAKGLFFILGEAACVGGIVVAESLRASYEAKINSTHDVKQKQSYINSADNSENIRNGLIVGAVALYAWNVIDGIVAKGKKKGIALGDAQLRVAPYVSPEAGGLALSVHF